MDPSVANRILEHLKQRREEMVEFAATLAEVESPSHDGGSQAAAFRLLTDRLEALGFRCRRFPGDRSGGQLLAVPEKRKRKAPIQLLLGHCDTVWPIGTVETMPVRVSDGKLFGPGVYDMKGGLTQGLFAIQTLLDLGMETAVEPIFFINSDEEIGSRESESKIRRLAAAVDRVYVLEPSLGESGKLKTSRKGVGRFEIATIGKAAHAGLDPDKGVSAIVAMAQVIEQLDAFNDSAAGVSVNVGTVAGGTRPNVIAAECRVEVDIRVRTIEQAEHIEAAISKLTVRDTRVRIEVTGGFSRPPLEATSRNQALWEQARQIAETLRIPIEQGAAGGGSDGNWTSLYAATLDGLGAVGDGAHATHEHLLIDKMPERAALLACMMLSELN